MEDMFRGAVTKIIDVDIFEIKISRLAKGNKQKYQNLERVQVANVEEFLGGRPSKAFLEKRLNGRVVICTVRKPWDTRPIIADLEML